MTALQAPPPNVRRPGPARLLDLEPLEVNLFRGRSPQAGWQRVFGGQVIGQALVAAVRTVEASRPPHSMHAYFLLPGDPKVPIIYDVDRIRDGKSFTTRRVTARQHGHPIFSMLVSFHDDEPAASTIRRRCRTCRRRRSCRANPRCAKRCCRRCPIRCGAITSASGRSNCARSSSTAISARNIPDGRFNVWIKTTGRLPDDPAIHQCVLAYASDMTLLDTALVPHGRTLFEKEFMAASLDHALWLHRPFRADDWLLYAQDSPNLHGSRGFSRGLIFTRDGTLVASVAQEGLVRLRRESHNADMQAIIRRICRFCCRCRRPRLAASGKQPAPPGSFDGAPPQYTRFSTAELERGFHGARLRLRSAHRRAAARHPPLRSSDPRRA